MGRWDEGVNNADAATEALQREEKSEEAKERAAKRNFNKHVLWCRLKLDPEQEPPRMREVLERLMATAKAAMLDNIEEDQEWERNTRMNANSILRLLTEALSAAAEELFPDGIPANNQMKGRHWNSKNREVTRLISERGALIRLLAHEKDKRATAARLIKLEAKVHRKQRQIRENLRKNRNAY